jgi:hypothetical protein
MRSRVKTCRTASRGRAQPCFRSARALGVFIYSRSQAKHDKTMPFGAAAFLIAHQHGPFRALQLLRAAALLLTATSLALREVSAGKQQRKSCRHKAKPGAHSRLWRAARSGRGQSSPSLLRSSAFSARNFSARIVRSLWFSSSSRTRSASSSPAGRGFSACCPTGLAVRFH